MASNTQPDEPEIVETHGHMTSCIHKMELNGHFLVNRKQKILVDNSSDPNPIKITIITHTRSIDDRSIIANESFVLGEGEPHRMTETTHCGLENELSLVMDLTKNEWGA